jgi:diacylglycerol kinase family enzyme
MTLPQDPAEKVSTRPPGRPGLVLNPSSLRNSIYPRKAEQLLSAFDRLGESILVGDRDALTAKLHMWQSEGLDLLAISGGDGTIQRVVNEALSVWGEDSLPRILILHGGTAGIISKESGHSDPLQAVQDLQESLQENRPIATESLPILKVGGRHTLSFGLGAFRKLSEAYVTYGRQIVLSHSWLGARLLTSYLARGAFARDALEPCLCRIRIGDQEYPAGHFVGLYACALRRISAFRPLEGVDCPDDAFKIVGVRPLDSRKLVRFMWRYFSGNGEETSEAVLLCGTRSMVVEPENGIVEYMADGEFYSESGPLEVSLGPRLNVVRLGN